jgi:hypothetical protein
MLSTSTLPDHRHRRDADAVGVAARPVSAQLFHRVRHAPIAVAVTLTTFAPITILLFGRAG